MDFNIGIQLVGGTSRSQRHASSIAICVRNLPSDWPVRSGTTRSIILKLRLHLKPLNFSFWKPICQLMEN